MYKGQEVNRGTGKGKKEVDVWTLTNLKRMEYIFSLPSETSEAMGSSMVDLK